MYVHLFKHETIQVNPIHRHALLGFVGSLLLTPFLGVGSQHLHLCVRLRNYSEYVLTGPSLNPIVFWLPVCGNSIAELSCEAIGCTVVVS